MKTNFENLFEQVDCLLSSVEKIHSILSKSNQTKPPPKNISLKGTIEFLRENGIVISVSKLYKLTSKKQIPFNRFNNKLLFNTVELEKWVNNEISKMSITQSTLIIKPNKNGPNRF